MDKYSKTLEALRLEAGLQDMEDTKKGLLEKKWTAVVRLQKKVMELEGKLSRQQEASVFSGGADAGSSSSGGGDGDGRKKALINRGLPREPAEVSMAGHRGAVTSVAIHPTFSQVASGSEDASIKLWDYESHQYENTLKGHTMAITCVRFNPSGTILASSSSDMTAKIWDISKHVCLKTLRGHDHTVSGLSFVGGGDQLVTCSRDQTIKCWDISSGFCVKTLNGHSDWVRCLSANIDNVHIASGGNDSTIIIWNLSNSQAEQTLRGHEHVVESLDYCSNSGHAQSQKHQSSSDPSSPAAHTGISSISPESTWLVSGSRDKYVKLWDTTKGTCIMSFACHENWVRSVIFHPSGKYIISCSDDKSIRVLDIRTERVLRTISNAHSHFISSIAFSPNHMRLVSGSVDKCLNVWPTGN